jgi:enoyl-CoA hydratase/carnithine racemase
VYKSYDLGSKSITHKTLIKTGNRSSLPGKKREKSSFVHFSDLKMDQTRIENLILVTRDQNGIATITINRPKSLNSLTRPMIVRLARQINALGKDDSVRVIILTGSGRAFCSGVDLTAAEEVFKGDVKDVEADPVAQMEQCKKPIIGAINGFAVTAGFEIALACDILIASKGAKFMDTHSRCGVFIFD